MFQNESADNGVNRTMDSMGMSEASVKKLHIGGAGGSQVGLLGGWVRQWGSMSEASVK